MAALERFCPFAFKAMGGATITAKIAFATGAT